MNEVMSLQVDWEERDFGQCRLSEARCASIHVSKPRAKSGISVDWPVLTSIKTCVLRITASGVEPDPLPEGLTI